MRLATIIVTFNGAKFIERCLEAIFNAEANALVIIVDNASTDNTLTLARRFSCKIIELNYNIGFGAANNIGMSYALEIPDVSHLFLLNQDAYVESNLFKYLETIPDEMSEACLACVQTSGDGKDLDRNCEEFYLNAKDCPGFLNDSYFDRLKEFYTIRFMNAAAWILPRDICMEVGGFSPTFFHYGEDSNYVDRMRFHGKKLLLATQCVVRHDRGGRSESSYDKDALKYARALIVRFSDPACQEHWMKFLAKKLLGLILLRGRGITWKVSVFLHIWRFKWIYAQRNRVQSQNFGVNCFLSSSVDSSPRK